MRCGLRAWLPATLWPSFAAAPGAPLVPLCACCPTRLLSWFLQRMLVFSGDSRHDRAPRIDGHKPSRSFAKPLRDLLGKVGRRDLYAAGLCLRRTGDALERNRRRRNRRAQRADQNPMAAAGRRRRATRPGTLVLRVEGPAAIEIQHLANLICERVNRFLGWRAVARLALRQAPLRRAARKNVRAADRRGRAAIAAGLPDIADDDLRQALARLGAAIKRRVNAGQVETVPRSVPALAERRANATFVPLNLPLWQSGADLDADPPPISSGHRGCPARRGAASAVAIRPAPGPTTPQTRSGRTGQSRPGRRRRARLRQSAGDHHRIRLDDLSALRALCDHDVSGAAEALHRHRQGAIHLPRIPARCAGRGGLHAGALRRQRQIHADRRDPVRQAAGMDGAKAGPAAHGNRQAIRLHRGHRSTRAWRIRRCSTASRRCATAPPRSSASTPRRPFSSTARSWSAISRSTRMAKEIDPYLKEG